MSLTYIDRGKFRTEWEAISGSLVIGSIRKNLLSIVIAKKVTWEWTLNIAAPRPGLQHYGRGETFEEARAQLEKNWHAWLQASGLMERPIS